MPKQNIIIIGLVLILIAGFSIYSFIKNEAMNDLSQLPDNLGELPALVVTMKDLKYSITETTIEQGDIVEFKNESKDEDYWPASNIHPSHGIYPEFDPRVPIKPGESWSFKFDRVGSWRFHDHLHPKEIKGVMEVVTSL